MEENVACVKEPRRRLLPPLLLFSSAMGVAIELYRRVVALSSSVGTRSSA
jgi:hypothetical protein